MKKGQMMVPEVLVKIVLTILVTIAVLYVLFTLVASFFAKPQTPEQHDFQRILAEVDDSLAQPYNADSSIAVPVRPSAPDVPVYVMIYPDTKAPDACRKQSCICLYVYQSTDKRYQETCKTYSAITSTCPEQCGPVCFSAVKRVDITPATTTVTVKRGCNELALS